MRVAIAGCGMRVLDLHRPLQRLERADHALAAADLRPARVGAELAHAREPRDDDRAEQHEDDLERELHHEVDAVREALVLVPVAP